jgi:autotransporter translocation and assembly factor TamB
MARAALRIAAIALAVLVVATAAGVALLTNTALGHERVRRIAQHALGQRAHGRVQIGALGGNLLRGAVVTDLTITDSAGAPFLAVPRASVRWSLRALLSRRIVITALSLERPVLVLDRPPSHPGPRIRRAASARG